MNLESNKLPNNEATQSFFDRYSGIALKYHDGAIFSVYTSRSNSPKRIAYFGKDPARATKVYTEFKTWKNDRKYLYMNDTVLGGNILLLKESGKEIRPYSLQGKVKSSTAYEWKTIGPFNRIPVTLWEEAREFVKDVVLPGNFSLSTNNFIQLLISDFLSQDKETRHARLENGLKENKKHKLKSGRNINDQEFNEQELL